MLNAARCYCKYTCSITYIMYMDQEDAIRRSLMHYLLTILRQNVLGIMFQDAWIPLNYYFNISNHKTFRPNQFIPFYIIRTMPIKTSIKIINKKTKGYTVHLKKQTIFVTQWPLKAVWMLAMFDLEKGCCCYFLKTTRLSLCNNKKGIEWKKEKARRATPWKNKRPLHVSKRKKKWEGKQPCLMYVYISTQRAGII